MPQKFDFDFSVSNLLGAKHEILKKLGNNFRVDPKYNRKWRKSVYISRIITLLSKLDDLRWKRLRMEVIPEHPPIFILGHWRSGTTYLHDLLSMDPMAGYTTTYQTVFPNNLFAFQKVLKFMMKVFLPAQRPGDGLPLRVDQPQEEEFSIGNEINYCFYYWMYFPKAAEHFRRIHFSPTEIPLDLSHQWKENYKRFVKRSLLNTNGKVFVSKNPPNTARIKLLLDIFPNAKFIFLHRNPYEVFRSCKKFFSAVIPAIQFQEIDEYELEEHILESYTALHNAYFQQRELIPIENIIEISYEQLISNPRQVLQQIISSFNFPSLENISEKLNAKIIQSKAHQIDQYELDEAIIRKINLRWDSVFTRLGYTAIGDDVT